jgi:endonuclease/exonuclease/phosphatase family metal-dependent hydrolase
MENKLFTRHFFLVAFLPILLFLLNSCIPPLAHVFEDVEDGIYLEKSSMVSFPAPDSSVKVMTWNIRFGIGRGPWFGDACGYKVVYSESEILANLTLIAQKIEELQPDIVLLQEVDIQSTRSAYVDELRWLLDHTYLNYAAYGSQWEVKYIPSDGLGRINETNVILSRWPLNEAKRIQLALRTDQIAPEKYLYERCCMVETKVIIPGFDDLYMVNIHASAFAQDDTRKKHLAAFKAELDDISAKGFIFVAGGDLNSIPPSSDDTDFCIEHKCPGEIFHQEGKEPYHKEGMYYEPETDGMRTLYNAYWNVIPLSVYLPHQSQYFTQTPLPDGTLDRVLDYMFTNNRWVAGASSVRQECVVESDHVPVVGTLVIRKSH